MFALQTLSLLLPIVVPGALLIVLLKTKQLTWLDVPIDHGLRIAGQPLFGRNKTYRGIVLYIVGSVLVFSLLYLLARNGAEWVHWLFTYNPIVVGVLFGVSYAAGELVNSFVKRRLGIKPGAVNTRHACVQRFFDLIDGPVAATIVLVLVYGLSPQSPVALLAGIGLHWIAEVTMTSLRLKKQ